MIDLEKMAKEHEKLFPNATLESQVWKLEEELSEFYYAKTETDQIKELSDVLIICGGLNRWCPRISQEMTRVVYNTIGYVDSTPLEIEAEVNRKWQVNLKRKWVWNGKTYHHEGNDNV